MQFTKAEDYGLHGMLYLAAKPLGKIVPLSEIAEEQEVPEKFLAKIFQSLAKSGLVKSHRGVKGGFSIGKPPDVITVKEVLESIQGPYFVAKCLRDPELCPDKDTCAVRRLMKLTQDKILGVFENHSLSDLVAWQGDEDTVQSTASK